MVCGWSWSMKIAERSSAIASGPSRNVAPERPAAGGGWQGRREGAIAELLPRPRTPPGGDQRSPISRGMLREGPLVDPITDARRDHSAAELDELELEPPVQGAR